MSGNICRRFNQDFENCERERFERERAEAKQRMYYARFSSDLPPLAREHLELHNKRVINNFDIIYDSIWKYTNPNIVTKLWSKPTILKPYYLHHKHFIEFPYLPNDTIHATNCKGHKGCIICDEPSTHYAVFKRKTTSPNVALCSSCADIIKTSDIGVKYPIHKKDYSKSTNTYE